MFKRHIYRGAPIVVLLLLAALVQGLAVYAFI
jgi:hypothetical protein